MAIQISSTKQTASDYQVGQFRPAPTNWKKKHLLAEKEWTYVSSKNSNKRTSNVYQTDDTYIILWFEAKYFSILAK